MLLNKFFTIIHKEVIGESMTAQIKLNQEHEIFKAHFPEQPIVPGVCQIQMVSEVLAAHIRCTVTLSDARNVKYLMPIDPNKTPEMNIQFTKIADNEESCKVTVVFVNGGQVYSKMTLTYHVVRDNSNIQ